MLTVNVESISGTFGNTKSEPVAHFGCTDNTTENGEKKGKVFFLSFWFLAFWFLALVLIFFGVKRSCGLSRSM